MTTSDATTVRRRGRMVGLIETPCCGLVSTTVQGEQQRPTK